MSKNSVVVERVFKVEPSLVWKALTEKELMKQWYIEVEDFKPEVGFKFIFWGGEKGEKKWKHLCEITEVIPEPTIIETTTKEVKKAAGTAVGFIQDLTSPQAEDVLMDVDERNLGYFLAFLVGCGLGVTGILMLLKRFN